MADILIKGMEMPTNRSVTITIDPNGEVYVYDTDPPLLLMAITLPEGHGKIVNAEEIRTRLVRKLTACKPGTIEELTFAVSIDIVDHADTIVPAEGGNADG